MNEREEMLNRVRLYDLALTDSAMYLDGHPNSSAALAYYQQNRNLYDQAKAAFEARFGPLTFKNNTDETAWQWIENPWPWEGADN